MKSGQKVILDLNGYTLQGYTSGCETILVSEGAELTIVDNSESGTGKIIPATGTVTVQLPVIRNNGTLTINGGIFEQNDAYGTIINWGTAIINGGKFIQSEDARWSILDNKGTLTINNGDFDGAASFWMVRNEASLTVNGGDFDSTGNANMIGSIYEGESLPEENKVTTDVTNGTFNSEGGIFVVYEGTDLNISGGEVTSVQSNAVYNAGNTTITGGTIKSENSAAIVLVNNEGAREVAKVNVSGATVSSATGRDAVEVINNVEDTNFGTATDENGNIVAGEVEIELGLSNLTVGDITNASITVGGVKVSEGVTITTSNNTVVKINDDNSIEAVGEGNAQITVKIGNIEKTFTISVAENQLTNPEDPTEDPTTGDSSENPTENPTENTIVDSTDKNTDTDIVQTGDYIYIAVIALAVIIIANIVYAVIRKRSAK